MRPIIEASRGRNVPSVQRRHRGLRAGAAAALLFVAGCATVDPAPRPLDPTAILRRLRSSEPASPVVAREAGAIAALTLEQAAALAVERNPQLQVVRAEVGVSRARLVEAGLLPDPAVGWDAMDVLANQWVNGDTEQENFVVGFGLTWRMPRPGEISALEAAALATLERSEWAVMRSEWRLAQDVAEAWIALASARARLAAANDLLELGRRTATALERAREVSAATGVEANLAAIDVADLELQRLEIEDEEVESRQRLNRLLGLAPTANYPIADPAGLLDAETEGFDAAAIVDKAVLQRPDLKELLADYAAAEAALRLEVVRQFPEISIGTGLELTLPIFSRWNGPAIDRAFAEREVMRRAVDAEIAGLRAEVHAAVAAYRKARRQADYIAQNVEPRLEESLRLTEASLAARELSTLEVLLTQRQILDTRMRALEARFTSASHRIRVLAASGTLFRQGAPTPGNAEPPSETDR